MARRLNPHHVTDIRRKIQASSIIHRLQQHIDGKIELSATQISAAVVLLDRSVAKLSQIQHVGDENNPIMHEAVVKFVGTAKTA